MSTQVTINDPEPKEEVNFWDLEFLKIIIPENVRLIPRELVEELKGKRFTVDQFYEFVEEQLKLGSPYCLLYALIDRNKKIQGFLWAEINNLTNSLFVNSFSVSKEYWHKGKFMPLLIAFLDHLRVSHKFTRVFWITTNDKFFCKHGFKRSKNVLMEFQSS